jgi:hypothetical protein
MCLFEPTRFAYGTRGLEVRRCRMSRGHRWCGRRAFLDLSQHSSEMATQFRRSLPTNMVWHFPAPLLTLAQEIPEWCLRHNELRHRQVSKCCNPAGLGKTSRIPWTPAARGRPAHELVPHKRLSRIVDLSEWPSPSRSPVGASSARYAI